VNIQHCLRPLRYRTGVTQTAERRTLPECT